jgi:ABC-type antimicrobial peptide transport system permease subunit
VVVNRELSGVLYDVRSLEPHVYAISGLLLLVAIVLACVLPTARSLRVNPREAMQAE